MKADSSSGLQVSCSREQFRIVGCLMKILDQEGCFCALSHIDLLAKQYLFHQGDELKHDLYILQKGWLLLKHLTESGRQQVIRLVLPGDVLGFQPDTNGPAIHSAVTLQESTVCCVSGLRCLCNQHPELALELARSEAYEAILSEFYMVNIAHQDARGKIVFMLLEIYQRLKSRGLIDSFTFPFPLKHEDIAETLGLTAVHVNRTLHKLYRENLLVLRKHEVTILNYDKLTALVDQEMMSFRGCGMEMRHG